MGLLDFLFGGGNRKVSKETAEKRGLHMPDLNLPVDEKFTIHFKKNGGKFLYCISAKEVSLAIKNIIAENSWQNHSFFVMDDRLTSRFEKENIVFTDKSKNSEIFFTTRKKGK